jgi:hypothetical protein
MKNEDRKFFEKLLKGDEPTCTFPPVIINF